MDSKRSHNPHTGDGALPGKIFIGGLPKDTTLDTFEKHFEKYGELIDSVIMKDRHTGRPRGFGFITFADASVVDTMIQELHIINGKEHLATAEDVTALKQHQTMTTALLGVCIANMCELSKNLHKFAENAERKGELLDLELKNLKQEAEKRNELMDLKIKCLKAKMEHLKSKAGCGGSSSSSNNW